MKFFQLLTIFLFTLFAHSETLTITDKKGRSLKVELVALVDSQLSFKKVGKSTVMSVSLDKLSTHSANTVREKMDELQDQAVKNPPLEIKVMINKNDRRQSGSSYMKTMAIEATVGLRNKDLNIEADECLCTILVVGEDQKVKEDFQVLGKHEFSLKPEHKMAEHTTKPTVTKYDSDNQGYGNIGGYKNDGYILIVRNSDKDVLATKTNISRLKSNFSENHQKQLLKVKKDTKLNRDMLPR